MATNWREKVEDPVAVVGFSFRFPQDAVSEDAFWDIIRNGRSTMSEVPSSRYNINGHHSHIPGRQDTIAPRGGHFVQGDISAFDAPFFKMSSAEAKAMDPQLRILLETTYHAFESAGISIDQVQGSNTSVFVGNLVQEYGAMFAYDTEINPKYQATGISSAMLSNRLSWFYNLQGSSVSIDTACSSSLVGLHLACQNLLQEESDMSLVGGVQLQLEPRGMTAPISRLGFLSPDGQCFSFDDRANGYSRGEGVGMLVLKRLSKAIEDGDTIRGVIRSTGSNQDGRTPSISQPSSTAQAIMIEKAYERAGLDFASTGYFEAHGTGTPVGDPIEAKGISLAFSKHRSPDSPIYVGSVKANIGHLEPLAGFAGLIKSILMLEKAEIVPNALLKNLNPRINADEWGLKFPTSSQPWPMEGLRRASVNSFGFGGTNAHVVVDDALYYLQSRHLHARHNTVLKTGGAVYTNGLLSNGFNAEASTPEDSEKVVFLLSASDENGIQRQAAALQTYLNQPGREFPEGYLHDLAFTLSNKRSILPWKSTVLASSIQELQDGLLGGLHKPVRTSESPLLGFVFTGQGAQWAAMGIELLRYPVYKDSLEYADAYLKSIGSKWSLLDELCAPTATSRIDNPDLAQPLCTALQIALVDLLASWNLSPQAVVGHSSGEIAAAYCAGALDRDSALRVAYFRGYCVAKLLKDPEGPKGGMLAVGLSEGKLAPYIASLNCQDDPISLSCGCINSPKSTTVTGSDKCIDELAQLLQADKIFSRKLNVPLAYHSRQMAAVADDYQASLAGHLSSLSATSEKTKPLYFSSVTGKLALMSELAQPDYWIDNLVSQVKFSEALRLMCSTIADRHEEHIKPLTYLLEVGPHCSLERPVRDTLAEHPSFLYDHTLRRSVSSMETAKQMVGRIVVHGHAVNIPAVNTDRSCLRHPRMLVDLPKYQFNHSQSYWVESRLSKNLRQRETPRHELLGIRSVDWNPMKPTWRFVIRQSDLPWVSHHTIDKTVIYPASGMLVMVLEGIRSISKASKVAGYRLRDINIGSALVIPPGDEGVEAQLHMSSHDTSGNKEVKVWNFWIHSVTGDDWKLHCSGEVAAEEKTALDAVSEGPEASDAVRSDLEQARQQCSTIIGKTEFYQTLWQKGAHFGELFQTLSDIRFDGEVTQATASLPFGDWRRKVKDGELTEHLIHPSTLDGLIHILFASMWNGLVNLPTMVPTQFCEVYVSQELLSEDADATLKLYGGVTEKGVFSIEGDVTAASAATTKPLITFRGLRLLGFHSNDAQGKSTWSSEPTSLFHQYTWKPEISLLSQSEVEEYCRQYTSGFARGGHDRESEIICRHFLSKALAELAANPQQPPKPHLENYVRWAKAFLEQEKESTEALQATWPGFDDDNTRDQLIEQYASTMHQKRLFVSYGQRLVPMLTGELDPLGPLFNEGLGESFYQTPLFSLTANRVAGFMDLFAHKNSDIKIIEIGAGTGSTTIPVLEALASHGRHAGSSLRARQYDFTDISPSFLAAAKERFAAHAGCMRFKTLDIENDPEEQGYEIGTYDVVIAAAVLHATSNIEKTLHNVKKLLKPGGRVVFSEPTNKRMATMSFVFGLLPGWWLSTEKYRSSGPLLSRPLWNEALLRAGFDGLEVSLPDDEEDIHGISLLVSQTTKQVSKPSITDSETQISTIIVTETPGHETLAADLRKKLVLQPNVLCDVVPSSSLFAKTSSSSAVYDQCISLLDVGTPVMTNMTADQFEALGQVMAISRQVFWVTEDCGEDAKNPEAWANVGFGKTMIREHPKLSWVSLNVQRGPGMAQSILKIVEQSRQIPFAEQETDIAELNGAMSIPRVVEAPHINSLLDSKLHGSKPQPLEVGRGGQGLENELELRFSPGRLDSFHYGPDPSVSQPLEDDQVRVSVRATGINFKDVMVSLNQVSDDHIGQEFAGLVTEVGPGLQGVYRTGDRVCGIVGGSFRSSLRAKGSHIMKMPEGMSFVEASALPLAYATAHYGLHHLGHLERGESILIHAAAGAVGQAAIHLARRTGATVYVTVSTPEKKQVLMNKFGIDPSHIFSSRHTFFAQQIMQSTGGQGVDVVLNSLTGRALAESWRCLAPFGRFIEIGKRDIATFNNLPMEPLMRNVSFCSLDLSVVAKHKDALMAKIMREVQDIVLREARGNSMTPYPLTNFPRSGVEEAFRLLQTGRHVGKVVIDWEQEDTIQVVSRSPLDYQFDSNATYVVSGGLGGIGRSIAEWMCRNGAKNLVLLSRSGPKSDTAKQLVTKLENEGVRIYAPICDISNADAVKAAVFNVEANMPPVKGCIQASMVVENRIFENYDLASFQMALDPKVKGTYNLHHSLPHGMDFFVMLSSLASIHGAASQSNYAAANAFQDAFARFRHSQGERCTSINLGIVESVGYIAERLEVAQNMNMAYMDHKCVRETDLHFLLKYACSPSLNKPPTAWEAQILAALTTPAFVRRGGVLQDHSWMRTPMFKHLYRMELESNEAGAGSEQVESAGAQLREVKNVTEGATVVTNLFAKRLARSLAVPVEDIDVNRPPHAFSVDSLVAVELLFWFSTEIHADVPVVQILGSSTIAQLGRVAAEKSQYLQGRDLK